MARGRASMTAPSAARHDGAGWVSRRDFLRLSGGAGAVLGALATTGATPYGADRFASAAVALQPTAGRPEASNMELVGFDNLQARSAYQVLVHHHTTGGADRWIVYVGHHGG